MDTPFGAGESITLDTGSYIALASVNRCCLGALSPRLARLEMHLATHLPKQPGGNGPAVSEVPSLHRQRRQKLINARENAPEKLDLRAKVQRDHPVQRPMPTHEARGNTTKWGPGVQGHRATIGLHTRRNGWSGACPLQPLGRLPCSTR